MWKWSLHSQNTRWCLGLICILHVRPWFMYWFIKIVIKGSISPWWFYYMCILSFLLERAYLLAIQFRISSACFVKSFLSFYPIFFSALIEFHVKFQKMQRCNIILSLILHWKILNMFREFSCKSLILLKYYKILHVVTHCGDFNSVIFF